MHAYVYICFYIYIYACILYNCMYIGIVLSHIKSLSSEHHFAHLQCWNHGNWVFPADFSFCQPSSAELWGPLMYLATGNNGKQKMPLLDTKHHQHGAMRIHPLAMQMCIICPSNLVLPLFDLALCTSPVP